MKQANLIIISNKAAFIDQTSSTSVQQAVTLGNRGHGS